MCFMNISSFSGILVEKNHFFFGDFFFAFCEWMLLYANVIVIVKSLQMMQNLKCIFDGWSIIIKSLAENCFKLRKIFNDDGFNDMSKWLLSPTKMVKWSNIWQKKIPPKFNPTTIYNSYSQFQCNAMNLTLLTIFLCCLIVYFCFCFFIIWFILWLKGKLSIWC